MRNHPLPLRRKLLLWTILTGASLVIAIVAVLALDLYLHRRFAATAVNYRGYRGPVVSRKQRDELRVVVLGGSTAFGYGVTVGDSMPALLERSLRARMRRPVTVVNLAFNNQGAYSFLTTLRDYEALDYDAVVLYEGYNDLGAQPNRSLFRHESPLFATFGYYPIFPTIFREKAMALRSGNPEAADREEKVHFRPNLADRTKAGALDAAASVSSALDRQLSRIAPEPASPVITRSGCSERWSFYCGCVGAAVSYASARGKNVFVVTQPYIGPAHRRQQNELAAMLRSRFARDRRVHYVDLGEAFDLRDRTLAYDGMHLVARGNAILAERLASEVAAAEY